jgi:hypothetical protein
LQETEPSIAFFSIREAVIDFGLAKCDTEGCRDLIEERPGALAATLGRCPLPRQEFGGEALPSRAPKLDEGCDEDE